jgi:hypothetical protein
LLPASNYGVRHVIRFLFQAIARLIHRQLCLQAFVPAFRTFAACNDLSAASAFPLQHPCRRASER